MTHAANQQKAPWHFWLVGLIGLPWNGFGAYDYFMSQSGGGAYLRSLGMTDAQIAYFAAMPAWAISVWAIGVWGALAGTILLLLRRKWALPVYGISFAAFLLSLVYTYALSDGARIMGDGWVMSLVIAAGCIFFIWYAFAMRKRGLLR